MRRHHKTRSRSQRLKSQVRYRWTAIHPQVGQVWSMDSGRPEGPGWRLAFRSRSKRRVRVGWDTERERVCARGGVREPQGRSLRGRRNAVPKVLRRIGWRLHAWDRRWQKWAGMVA